jgi:3-dehydroquinate synthase class II
VCLLVLMDADGRARAPTSGRAWIERRVSLTLGTRFTNRSTPA